MFFQRAFAALLAAIADIRWSGKVWAKIFFIRNTGGSAAATSPTKPVGRIRTVMAEFPDRTLMQESETAVVEGASKSAGFLKADMSLYFFRNSRAVFAELSCNGFKTVLFVKQGFHEDYGIKG